MRENEGEGKREKKRGRREKVGGSGRKRPLTHDMLKP